MAKATLVVDFDPRNGRVRYWSLWPDEETRWTSEIFKLRSVRQLIRRQAKPVVEKNRYHLVPRRTLKKGCDLARPISTCLDFAAEIGEGLVVVDTNGNNVGIPYEKVFRFPR